MLRQAFNALTRIHSRPAQLKRLGASVNDPDIYSPCRITPANYFQYLRGPENTAIHGREFIIPADSMLGQFSQNIAFSAAPASGTFKLRYGVTSTTALAHNAPPEDIQSAIRLLPGLASAVVTGSINAGLSVIFQGFSTQPNLISVVDSTLASAVPAAVTSTVTQAYQKWSSLIERGDKLVDTVYNLLTVDQIVEMVDMGGDIMGYRVRAE